MASVDPNQAIMLFLCVLSVIVAYRPASLKKIHNIYNKSCVYENFRISAWTHEATIFVQNGLIAAAIYVQWNTMDFTSLNNQAALWLTIAWVFLSKYWPVTFFEYQKFALAVFLQLSMFVVLVVGLSLEGVQTQWVPFGLSLGAGVLELMQLTVTVQIYNHCTPEVSEEYQFGVSIGGKKKKKRSNSDAGNEQ